MMKEDAELFYFATHSIEDAERIVPIGNLLCITSSRKKVRYVC